MSFTLQRDQFEVSGEISFLASNPAVSDLANGSTIFTKIGSRWKLGVYQTTTSTDFTLHFSLLPIPTISEFYEHGSLFDRKANVKWQLCWIGTENNWSDSNGSFKYSFEHGRQRYSNSSLISGPHSGTGISANSDHIAELLLRLTIKEKCSRIPQSKAPGWMLASAKIAHQLLDSSTGDVIFIVRDANPARRKLYAYKSILSANSEYFATRFQPEWRQSRASAEPTLNETFSERSHGSADATEVNETALNEDHRQIIYMDDPEDDIDFVTLHNILYYIYTGSVNLHVKREGDEDYEFPEGYPDEPDLYCLFRNADKFLLTNLKDICYLHLTEGMTHENVAERLFHGDCEHHQDLKERYMEYLLANYDKVKETVGWERVLNDEDVPASVVKYRMSLLFEITKKLKKA